MMKKALPVTMALNNNQSVNQSLSNNSINDKKLINENGFKWPKNIGDLVDDAGGKIDRMLYQQ